MAKHGPHFHLKVTNKFRTLAEHIGIVDAAPPIHPPFGITWRIVLEMHRELQALTREVERGDG